MTTNTTMTVHSSLITHSRRAPGRHLGDTAQVTTAPATDATGRTWPAGTLYAPVSGGWQGEHCCTYQDVVIDGRQVRFLDGAAIKAIG